jgi:hypothetical protein
MVDTKAPSIVISSPNEQKIVTSTTTVNFLVYNFSLSDGNGIQVTLDGGTPFTVFTTSTTFTGLSVGLHTIKAQLINADLTLNTNVEAIAEGEFIVSNSTYNSPYIEILSPKINQIYSSSPVMIEFSVHNFPILATGQHLRYKINDGAPVDYYTADPISLSSLSAGKNTVTMFLVDKKGNDLGYAYGTVSVDFIVGLNSLALVKLYVNSKAIYNSEMTLTTNAQRLNVDVGNITFINLYCPIDIQVIENDMSLVNKNGSPTLLVAKMRTPSWTYSLGSHAASLECAARIAKNVSNTSASVTSAEFNGIAIKDLIYSSKFLDGYSVVQLDLSGNTIMSDNNAQFALSKEDARELLGSAEKIGENELIIGDSCNKRAIISNVDLVTQTSQVIFEYESDRYIPDFHLINQDNVEIRVKNDSIDESSIIVRNGTNVVWINDSSAPITIVSGTTSYEAFNLDPDLNLYGDLFKSQVLDIGERFSYKFISNGNTNYFCYPSILTGSIITTKNRVSDRDQYLITESDLDGPFSSRIIKVDSWGNVLMSFGEGYLVKPRDCRPLLNGSIIIST